jgi:hypothetical protein
MDGPRTIANQSLSFQSGFRKPTDPPSKVGHGGPEVEVNFANFTGKTSNLSGCPGLPAARSAGIKPGMNVAD